MVARRRPLLRSQTGGFFSRGNASTSKSVQHVTESAVLPSEIGQLPDFQGYLKFASRPEWIKAQLHRI
jgi:hypothetical protein